MRILFHNYSTTTSTESRYLAASMQNCGLQADLWADPNISAYDMLDSFRPDVLISHYKFLTNDIVKYLSQSEMSLALNTTGATQAELIGIESLIDQGVDLKFGFSNDFKFNTKSDPNRKFKIHSLLPAADLFLAKAPRKPKEIVGVLGVDITQEMEEIVNSEKPHHLMSLSTGSNGFDFNTNLAELSEILSFYSKILICGDHRLFSSQLFFDACLNAHSLEVLPVEESKAAWTEFLGVIFEEPPEGEDASDMTSKIKNQILTNHTPFNRAAKMLRLLGDDESAEKMEKMRNEVVMQP